MKLDQERTARYLSMARHSDEVEDVLAAYTFAKFTHGINANPASVLRKLQYQRKYMESIGLGHCVHNHEDAWQMISHNLKGGGGVIGAFLCRTELGKQAWKDAERYNRKHASTKAIFVGPSRLNEVEQLTIHAPRTNTRRLAFLGEQAIADLVPASAERGGIEEVRRVCDHYTTTLRMRFRRPPHYDSDDHHHLPDYHTSDADTLLMSTATQSRIDVF